MRRRDGTGRRRLALWRRRWVRYGALVVLVLLAVLVIVGFEKVRGVGLSDAVGEFAPSAGTSVPDDGDRVVESLRLPVGDWFAFEVQVPSHGSLPIDVRDVVPEDDRGRGQGALPLGDVRSLTRWPSVMSQRAWDDASPWSGHWPSGATESLVVRVPVPSCPLEVSSLRFDASVLGFPEQYTVSLDLEIRVRPIGGTCRSG